MQAECQWLVYLPGGARTRFPLSDGGFPEQPDLPHSAALRGGSSFCRVFSFRPREPFHVSFKSVESVTCPGGRPHCPKVQVLS